MSIASWFLAQTAKLPPATMRSAVTRSLVVTAKDGIALKTDHYAPDAPGPHPTLLMRLPYGREAFSAVGEVYAERGYHVVIQACRGTGGSGGHFDPLTHERDDGLATLDWIKQQDWFDGRLGTTGPSYLGYAQWAICDALPPGAAMSTKVSSAEFRSVVFPSGAFHLQLWLSWVQTVIGLRRDPLGMFRRMMTGGIEKRTEAASMTLPLVEADIVATGRKVNFWRRWFDTAIEDGPFWQALDHRHRIGPSTPPNHFISGWYDFMINQLMADYATTVAAGQTPHLTVGPWFHVSGELQLEAIRATLHWMNAHLLGDRSGLRDNPVHIYIMGRNQWRDYEAYPPPGAAPHVLHLHSGQGLRLEPCPATTSDRYLYDPGDPTPNQGGNIFAFQGAGPVDNHTREVRADVLTYTSPTLMENLTVIGQGEVTLYASADQPYVDFFVRLCDVNTGGISTNIADGLIRCCPGDPEPQADGLMKLTIRLNHTAHEFKAGHRLRLQVSSGAHPRYARNTGTEEPIGSATTLQSNRITIFRDPEHPSTMSLPTYRLD